MGDNPYEAPQEPESPRPPRDYSLIISIVVTLALLAAIIIPAGARA